MSGNNYSVFNAMVDIIASPTRALDEVKDHVAWLWAPLLLVLGLTCAAFVYYYSWVDMDWFVEETIRAMPPEQRAEAGPAVRGLGAGFYMGITVASVIFVTFVMYAIFAAYYHLVAKIGTSGEVKYGQWFALNAWANFPGILGAIAVFVVILLADSNQVGQHELSPLSFNQLFIQAEPGEPWFNWGNSINVLQLWSVFLAGLGFSRWTGASLVKGLVVAAIPLVLIYGIWAALV